MHTLAKIDVGAICCGLYEFTRLSNDDSRLEAPDLDQEHEQRDEKEGKHGLRNL